MEIKELRSTLVILFPMDEYDFKALSDEAFAARINKAYGCAKGDNIFNVALPMVVFGPGKITISGNIRVIDSIVIEERKITLRIGGTSQEARYAMSDLLEIISSFETRHKPERLVPIVEVDESVCIAKLDFVFPKLLYGSAGGKMPEVVSGIPSKAPEGFTVQVVPSALRYRVSYRGENATLSRHHIVLNDKALSLEMREGTDPAEQIYFASGPLKSDELLFLLRSLEEEMK